MKKLCFNGCSFTVGEGFDVDQREFHIYDRLVCKNLAYQHTNIAKSGSSNYEIFMRSARAMLDDHDILFVQWSALNRIWFYPGPDTEYFVNDGCAEFRYRDIYLAPKAKAKFEETLLLLNHDYHNIIALIDYCSILDRLAERHGKIVIYINGLVPWTDDLSRPLGKDLGQELSKYTKEILDFDDRDDDAIFLFLNDLRAKFASLDQSRWINLFESFQKFAVDIAPHGHHPGIQSHEIMADKILQYLELHHMI
jgi:hypothetical protein